jgi:hypothetical protein
MIGWNLDLRGVSSDLADRCSLLDGFGCLRLGAVPLLILLPLAVRLVILRLNGVGVGANLGGGAD